ncbi:MAG: glucose dehydrogenase [Betaproteobacteria bacterium HGW-Betaproteobacteria-1]|jgi:glucose/arabinose dehydrogenase|nr:MAG: glucose dehydrogenase [Betaproteobacteria bacterium HGW-Betaproteobacteria-1]
MPRPANSHSWQTLFSPLLLCCGLLLNLPTQAGQSLAADTSKVQLKPLVENLKEPWSMAFLPDGRLLVTEKSGKLRMVENGKLLPQAIGGVPAVVDRGQGGLLDIALHPQYAENGWLYLSYSTKGEGGSGTEVMRAKLKGMQLTDSEVIFRQAPKINSNKHFGSRLVFDREGFLYITLGDRGEMERAQDLAQHIGKVIRLHDDGRVPQDNPFAANPDALPEIYSYGHRNVQGAALNPFSGKLWTHEHGPQGGDEINILQAGTNFGWPVITYGVNYFTGTKIGEGTKKPGMAQPLYKWVPSIAPSGMVFYTGDAYPGWKNHLFVGSLKFQTLVKLTLDGDKVVKEERLFENLGRVRDVRQGPDGLLYLIAGDRLLQLQPVR